MVPFQCFIMLSLSVGAKAARGQGRGACGDERGGDARTDRDAVILLSKRVNPRETHRCRRGRRIPARADLGPSPLVPALPATESCGGQPRCLRRTPCSVSCAGACVHKREGRGFQKSHGSRMSRLVRSCLYCAPKSLSPALVGFFWTDVVISDEPGDEDESVD